MYCFVGMASHPRTVKNMQEKMSQSFNKDVLLWKKELTKFHAVKRFLHEVIESQKMTGENGMELCTINLKKDAVSNCKTYTEEIYDECISKLRACETKVYEEEDVLGLLDSNPATRYRYFVLWTT